MCGGRFGRLDHIDGDCDDDDDDDYDDDLAPRIFGWVGVDQ